MRDLLAFLGDSGFQLQLFERMLVAQLHAHPGQQFGGLPGGGDNVVCSQIQGARALAPPPCANKNHARVGGRIQGL